MGNNGGFPRSVFEDLAFLYILGYLYASLNITFLIKLMGNKISTEFNKLLIPRNPDKKKFSEVKYNLICNLMLLKEEWVKLNNNNYNSVAQILNYLTIFHVWYN